MLECMAIWQNRDLPAAQKILLHPDPVIDLFMAVFDYGLFTGTWLLLLNRWSFPKKAVFLMSGLYGLAAEQNGAIAYGMIIDPVRGLPLASIIVSVYGVFPFLAYLLTEKHFPPRPKPCIKSYLRVVGYLFLFWAFYGNLIYRGFHRLFPV